MYVRTYIKMHTIFAKSSTVRLHHPITNVTAFEIYIFENHFMQINSDKGEFFVNFYSLLFQNKCYSVLQ